MRTQLKKDWSFHRGAFQRFLHWLDDGADSGGETYLEIRRRLVSYFTRKNCARPDELADETLTRVARRLEEENGAIDSPPARYCYIVARYVLLENHRKAELHEVGLTESNLMSAPPDATAVLQERRLNCLECCLRSLGEEQRTFLLDYYRDERREKIDGRRQLAERLGVSLNALSIRACRLREKLQECVRKCSGDKP